MQARPFFPQKLEPSWVIIQQDDLYFSKVVDTVAKHFPEEFNAISQAILPSNRYHALKRFDVVFLNNASSAERDAAKEALKRVRESLDSDAGAAIVDSIYTELRENTLTWIEQELQHGKVVLVDAWGWPEEIHRRFANYPVIEALLYNPFTTTLEFFQRRRQEALDSGDMANLRYYNELLPSYTTLFHVGTEMKANSFAVKKVELAHHFERIAFAVDQSWQERPKRRFTRWELNLFELEGLKKKLIPDPQAETLYFEPKIEYDIILNRENCTMENSAKKLRDQVTTVETGSGWT